MRSRLRDADRSGRSGPRRSVALAATSIAAVASLLATASPASAGETTTTTLPPLQVQIVPDYNGAPSDKTLAVGSSGQFTVRVTNRSERTLFNRQIVIKVGVKPDAVGIVRDGGGNVGVNDIVNGQWFHTIAAIAPSGIMSFVVSFTKVCPGKYPVVARVDDVTASISLQWVGQAPSGMTCGPDESERAFTPAYFDLPWPPTTSVPAPTTIAMATPAPTSVATTIALTGAVTTTTPSTTTPSTTTTTVATTTTKARATRVTTVLVCKTVGKRRVCTPKQVKVTTTTRANASLTRKPARSTPTTRPS